MGLFSMRSIGTHGLRPAALISGRVLALAVGGYGQSSGNSSLGDLARKQRQKQQAKDAHTTPKKVVTYEGIPEHPEAPSEPSASGNPPADGGQGDSPRPAAGDVMKTGEQWKAAIQQQKNAVADLQSHIDKLEGSIHFVEANRYRNGMEYNKVQAEKQQQVQRLESQLDERKKNLEQMQESARKAGFGSSVWDP